MPFTISHAAFAYPLKRVAPKYLSTAGLVLGAMSPDLEYFVYLEPYRSIGHTVTGFFLQAIPLAILISLVFHYIIKPRLAYFMPSMFSIDARLHRLWQTDAPHTRITMRSIVIFLISLAIGFASHIFIDEWTHANGLFSNVVPGLEREVFSGIALHKLLQYGLSLLGFFIILVTAVHALWKSDKADKSRLAIKDKLLFWVVSFGIALLITILKMLLAASGNFLGILFVAPFTGLCVGMTVACLLWSNKLTNLPGVRQGKVTQQGAERR